MNSMGYSISRGGTYLDTFKAIIETGDNEWNGINENPEQLTKTILPSWAEIEKASKDDWPLRIKEG